MWLDAFIFRKLRSYIDDQNAILVEEMKAAKSKVAEAREKVRRYTVVCFLFVKWCYSKLSHGVHIDVYMLSTGKKS